MNTKKINITFILRFLMILVLISICFLTLNTIKTQNNSGSYSSVCHFTDESRDWIIERFGKYEDIESLLTAIDVYACENFTYVSKDFYIQNFNLDKFIFDDNLHGLCFDFASFVKNVVCVISEKNDLNTRAYVVDVILKNGVRHSYNLIQQDKKSYFLDVTNDVSLVKKHTLPFGVYDISGQTIEEYAKKYDETVYNIH